MLIFMLVLSLAVGLWAGYLFVDWISHGCPNRFEYPK